MARLLALLALAAVASSAPARSPCNQALRDYGVQEYRNKCTLDYGRMAARYAPECNQGGPQYNRDTCASFTVDYRKCLLRENELVFSYTYNFDRDTFQKYKLRYKCDSDPKFKAAFDKCYASTMKYFEFNRLFGCLIDATN
ncbi:uncharacterized protein LOC108673847 [Hyalella azteca]|uniref:Uncharacterized protein LOC108673847 n=1 Tax=Hyalella azteca TaxID=294128 RepID=A0A8B7NU25_HYAAZ|nr:uncharacterized protein LOC108673847 [Hyalella azteca]XP_018017222.1 uncharacterized protein LOC108673847 [Hyalella azteca]